MSEREGPSEWQQWVALLDSVPAMSLAERCHAIERLAQSSSPWVRERALHMGAALLPDARIVALLREEADDVLRNVGLEMLKLRGGRAFALALELLSDHDVDVVLQAVLALDALRDPRAVEPLSALLRHRDRNVVQAVIVALGQLGDARVVPELVSFLHADTWLRVAAVQALGDLRSRRAVGELARLLADAEMSTLAAEALARIGGRGALVALARHWVAAHDALDAEALVGLVAHVAEGLVRAPQALGEALALARTYLTRPDAATRTAAARLLLALGAGEKADDDAALAVLAASDALPLEPPPSLSRRLDLVPSLIDASRALYAWGVRLAARHASRLAPEVIVAAMHSPHAVEAIDDLARLLARTRHPLPAHALLALHARLAPTERMALVPALRRAGTALRDELARAPERYGARAVILCALVDPARQNVGEELAALEPEWLLEAVDHLSALPAVLRQVPWGRLLARDADGYAAAAARAVAVAGLRELGHELCEAARRTPQAVLIRALGELAEPEGAAVLEPLIHAPGALTRALALDALGRVGGTAGRGALLRALPALSPAERAVAYRALARCCLPDDAALFVAATRDGDWEVRLAAGEALARLRPPGSQGALLALASDPVAAVAERAAALIAS